MIHLKGGVFWVSVTQRNAGEMMARDGSHELNIPGSREMLQFGEDMPGC